MGTKREALKFEEKLVECVKLLENLALESKIYRDEFGVPKAEIINIVTIGISGNSGKIDK
jgi:hypothetical protein